MTDQPDDEHDARGPGEARDRPPAARHPSTSPTPLRSVGSAPAPDPAVPDPAVPDPADPSPPDPAVPNRVVSDLAAADPAVPDRAAPDPAVPERAAADSTAPGPAGRSRTRDRGDDPGAIRLLVAVGDKPARWYRTPAEAVADARPLTGGAEPGDVVARAWTAEPAEGPPAWELRRGPRRRLRWARAGGGPGPGSA